MAGSVNKVILVGNLGRDPESRTFQNGGKVVNLRIATSESWKDRNTGERKEKTEWHSVAIRSEEHTSELQSLMRISYAVFCLKKNTTPTNISIKQCTYYRQEDIQLYNSIRTTSQ